MVSRIRNWPNRLFCLILKASAFLFSRRNYWRHYVLHFIDVPLEEQLDKMKITDNAETTAEDGEHIESAASHSEEQHIALKTEPIDEKTEEDVYKTGDEEEPAAFETEERKDKEDATETKLEAAPESSN